jgi:hypothetical protein
LGATPGKPIDDGGTAMAQRRQKCHNVRIVNLTAEQLQMASLIGARVPNSM